MKMLSWLFDPQEYMFGYGPSRAAKFILWCLVVAVTAVCVWAAVLFTSSLSEIFAFSIAVGIFSCVFVYAVLPLLFLMAVYSLWKV